MFCRLHTNLASSPIESPQSTKGGSTAQKLRTRQTVLQRPQTVLQTPVASYAAPRSARPIRPSCVPSQIASLLNLRSWRRVPLAAHRGRSALDAWKVWRGE